jgi:hypothetical protein
MQSISSPAIADSDGDGVADIITGCDDGNLYVIGNPSLLFSVQGHVYKSDGITPELNPMVSIYNVDSGDQWIAHVEEGSNFYQLDLIAGTEIHVGDTLRIISKNDTEYICVEEHIITQDDFDVGFVTIDLILDVHYRDLADFPWYLSYIDTGATTMKMMLDYLMWNSTTHPEGPPYVYDEQTLFNTYAGGDYINASELAFGINDMIDDHAHGWIYGYFMAPHGYETAEEALRAACVWIDFPVDYYNEYRTVDVPKLGHPNHVPVAIPLDGDYSHWVSVRGIHTDQNCWPPDEITEPLNVYGFWINDPLLGGVGANTYVTVEKLTDDYYTELNVPGDWYNGKYTVVTDPPNLDVEIQEQSGDITFIQSEGKLTQKQSMLIQRQKFSPLRSNCVDRLSIDATFDAAYDVLIYSDYAEQFSKSEVSGKPVYSAEEITVEFMYDTTVFSVTISNEKGELRQIQII